MNSMISEVETKRTSDRVTISFPVEDFKSDEIDEIVSLVRVALIARKSRMSAEEAEIISEEIKASWWVKNKDRILKKIEANG